MLVGELKLAITYFSQWNGLYTDKRNPFLTRQYILRLQNKEVFP